MQTMEDGALDQVASVAEDARTMLRGTPSVDQLRFAVDELVQSSDRALRIAACRGERLTTYPMDDCATAGCTATDCPTAESANESTDDAADVATGDSIGDATGDSPGRVRDDAPP
ncbi:hypothetical protein [Streptomyces zagrosensis]|uniref:Uncharacterized protein n=1 Tax=Streptomyces zagrosensis TaxID=1042984 RepID=A0A7W9Q6Y5_9ACTN|nr:hypothetical protein [Streptomyces zagrosensis]MBB5934509.1 hypothetical protein [Streptomyces zagrosensis]